MMRTYAAIGLGWLFLYPGFADAQPAPAVPVPTPAPPTSPAPTPPVPPSFVPPPPPTTAPAAAAPASPPAPTTAPAPAAAPAPTTRPAGPAFEFTLGAAQNGVAPYTHGSAKTEEGKIDVSTEPNVLKLVMSGGVGANVFFGFESTAVQSFSVVQEFDITSSDPSVSEVILSVDSGLIGFVRAKHKGSACVQVASVSIAPVGWTTTPLYVTHPQLCVAGPNEQEALQPLGAMNKDPLPTITGPPMPLGRYVIQANFVIQADARGFLDAHSTAIFSPEPTELDPWEREHDIYKGEDKAGYGFTTIVTAAPVNGKPVANAWDKHLKKMRVAKRNPKANADTVTR